MSKQTSKQAGKEAHCNLRPISDWVAIIPDEPETEFDGIPGFIVPDIAKERPTTGIVLVTGPGRETKGGERIPCQVSTGDRVVFEKFAGKSSKIGPIDVQLVRASSVLCVIEE